MTMQPTTIGPNEPRSFLEKAAGGKAVQQISASGRKEKSDEFLARTYQWLIHNRSKTTLSHVTDMLRDADFTEERANAVVDTLVWALWYYNAPGNNRMERLEILNLELDAAEQTLRGREDETEEPAAAEPPEDDAAAAELPEDDADAEEADPDADDPEDVDALLDTLYRWAQEDEELRADAGSRDFRNDLRRRRFYNTARLKIEVEMSLQRDMEAGSEIVDFGEVKAMLRANVPLVDVIDRMGPQFGVALAICNGSIAHDHINRRHIERAIAQVAEQSSYEGDTDVKMSSGAPGKKKQRNKSDDDGE